MSRHTGLRLKCSAARQDHSCGTQKTLSIITMQEHMFVCHLNERERTSLCEWYCSCGVKFFNRLFMINHRISNTGRDHFISRNHCFDPNQRVPSEFTEAAKKITMLLRAQVEVANEPTNSQGPVNGQPHQNSQRGRSPGPARPSNGYGNPPSNYNDFLQSRRGPGGVRNKMDGLMQPVSINTRGRSRSPAARRNLSPIVKPQSSPGPSNYSNRSYCNSPQTPMFGRDDASPPKSPGLTANLDSDSDEEERRSTPNGRPMTPSQQHQPPPQQQRQYRSEWNSSSYRSAEMNQPPPHPYAPPPHPYAAPPPPHPCDVPPAAASYDAPPPRARVSSPPDVPPPPQAVPPAQSNSQREPTEHVEQDAARNKQDRSGGSFDSAERKPFSSSKWAPAFTPTGPPPSFAPAVPPPFNPAVPPPPFSQRTPQSAVSPPVAPSQPSPVPPGPFSVPPPSTSYNSDNNRSEKRGPERRYSTNSDQKVFNFSGSQVKRPRRDDEDGQRGSRRNSPERGPASRRNSPGTPGDRSRGTTPSRERAHAATRGGRYVGNQPEPLVQMLEHHSLGEIGANLHDERERGRARTPAREKKPRKARSQSRGPSKAEQLRRERERSRSRARSPVRTRSRSRSRAPEEEFHRSRRGPSPIEDMFGKKRRRPMGGGRK